MKHRCRSVNGLLLIFTLLLITALHYQEQNRRFILQRSTRQLSENIPVIELNSTNMNPVYFGTERFHVILTFRIINSSESTNASLRMNEYIDCLKSFLNNPHVKQVHLMHDSPEMPGYIQKKAGAHPKLKLHKVKSPDVVLTLHQFAFTHLKGQVAVITKADITLGEGFEEVDKKWLVKNKLFYSLSSHVRECSTQQNYCLNYTRTHDTFVFVPKGNIPARGKKLLSHLIYSLGTENIVMYMYGEILKYKILNPCPLLRVYHHHCSSSRTYPKKQIRVNRKLSYKSYPRQVLK